MMNRLDFTPARQLPPQPTTHPGDTLVIFGEVFARGYVTGLIDAATRHGASCIYSTVGRRDENNQLRPLTQLEIQEKNHDGPLINVPLEMGFDSLPDQNGVTLIDHLKPFGLKDWQEVQFTEAFLNELITQSQADFRERVKQWVQAVAENTQNSSHVTVAHTMAGGFPRAKVVMPIANRVFKGAGDRYLSSQVFWESGLGQLCRLSFQQVTAESFRILVEESRPWVEERQRHGKTVSFMAYGYHGTEVVLDGELKWQAYSPYLQGWAKKALEHEAQMAWSRGIKSTVFNAPEILTNSSAIFPGLELCLYLLVPAIAKYSGSAEFSAEVLERAQSSFLESTDTTRNSKTAWDDVLDQINSYYQHPAIAHLKDFNEFPCHNTNAHMDLMLSTSKSIQKMQNPDREPLTFYLSELVVKATGELMWAQSYAPEAPSQWLGHDIIAQCLRKP